MMRSRFFFGLFLRSLLIIVGFVLLLFAVWIGLSFHNHEFTTVPVNIIKNVFIVSISMVLGAEIIIKISNSPVIKKYSGFLGWLALIMIFSIAVYLSMKYGY